MSSLTVNTPRAYEGGDINRFPVIATDIIYEGAAVGLVDATGHAQPLTSSDRFVGFANAKADNAAGAAAAINVYVKTRGRIQLSVSGAVITDVGLPVYATDENAFQFIATSAVFVGYLWRFVSAGVAIVEFDAVKFRDPYEGWTHETTTDDVTGDSEDNGKCFWFNADNKKFILPVVANAIHHVRCVNAGYYGQYKMYCDLDGGDSLEGPGVTATDGEGHINTKTTARRGDHIEFELVDGVGYTITSISGTWVQE